MRGIAAEQARRRGERGVDRRRVVAVLSDLRGEVGRLKARLAEVGYLLMTPGRAAQTAFAAPLALILAGAIGNLIDRFSWGAVADFLNVTCCGVRNPWSFNVADIAIFAGFSLLLIPFGSKATGSLPAGGSS